MKLRLSSFALLIVILFGCGEDEKLGSTLHKIKYYEDNNLYADLTFSYDDQGRIIKTSYRDLNNPGTGAKIGTFEYVENQIIYQDGDAYHEFTFSEDGLIEYALTVENSGQEYTGALAFSYTSGNLTGLTFEDASFTIDTDNHGNIIKISSVGGFDSEYSFDDKDNPLQGVPGYLFTIGIVSNSKHLRFEDLVHYFSKNNIVGNIYSAKYDQGKVVKISRDENYATWTQVFVYTN